jgi:hypothetical protein
MAKSASKPSKKSRKPAKKAKAVKVAQPRKPLSEAQVKALLNEHPEIRAFRNGTTEGRQIARQHLSSGKVGDDGAKFAATLNGKGLSFREIEAGMGLVFHNGMTAYRLVIRGKKLNAADKRAASKAAKTAPEATAAEVAAPVAEPTPAIVAETPAETPAAVETAEVVAAV